MQTQNLYIDYQSIGGVFANSSAICGLLGYFGGLAGIVASVGCSVFVGSYIWSFNNALTQAFNDGFCLRVRYGLTGLAFFSDASQYCQWD
jgi:ABC-type lipoprotein release transport system permease subunit